MTNNHREQANSLRNNGVTWEVACICGQTFALRNEAAVKEALRLHTNHHGIATTQQERN